MANDLSPAKETAIVQTLETNLRNPDARDTSQVFQQQLGSLTHGEQQKIINDINRDKQTEGYGSQNPLPELTLHNDGQVKEKIAGNSSELGVWAGNAGAKFGDNRKAPADYTGTLENGGFMAAGQSFGDDLLHDPIGAIEAAGRTIGQEASNLYETNAKQVQNLSDKVHGKQDNS